MALLLKVNREAISDNSVIVAAMKSAKLSETDLGEVVYIWFNDTISEKSALSKKATLISYAAVTIPQVRDLAKLKHALRLVISPLTATIASPLTTDDLEPFRYSEAVDGVESLGKIHRDRNDKIIRLSSGQSAALESRFVS